MLPEKGKKLGDGQSKNMEQQPVTFDIPTFRQHVELYEMMIEAAKKRTLSEITPKLERVSARLDAHAQKIDSNSLFGSGQPLAASAYSSPVIVRRSGSDLWVFFALGIWLGAIAYVAYKKGYFIK